MVIIEKREYDICENEFKKIYKLEYCNLEMYDDIGTFERLRGLIQDICVPFSIKSPIFINPTHGGFLPITISEHDLIENVNVYFDIDKELSNLKQYENINNNVTRHSVKKINLLNDFEFINTLTKNNVSLLFSENLNILNDSDKFNNLFVEKYQDIIVITNKNDFLEKQYDCKYWTY